MSADHLFFEWWVEDGNVWIGHDCIDGRDEYRLPIAPGEWSIGPDGVPVPSFDCSKCGRHTVISAADRKEAR